MHNTFIWRTRKEQSRNPTFFSGGTSWNLFPFPKTEHSHKREKLEKENISARASRVSHASAANNTSTARSKRTPSEYSVFKRAGNNACDTLCDNFQTHCDTFCDNFSILPQPYKRPSQWLPLKQVILVMLFNMAAQNRLLPLKGGGKKKKMKSSPCLHQNLHQTARAPLWTRGTYEYLDVLRTVQCILVQGGGNQSALLYQTLPEKCTY